MFSDSEKRNAAKGKIIFIEIFTGLIYKYLKYLLGWEIDF